MTIAAQSIIQTVAVDKLQDAGSIKWTCAELCRYFNQSQRDIATARPDLCSRRATLALAAGSLQTIPTTARMLLNAERNTAGNKRAVTMPKNCRAVLDAQVPNWRSGTPSSEIQHVMYDVERDPLHFETYPPATTSASLELVLAGYPTDITIQGGGTTFANVTGNMDLQDVAGNALIELICFRAYSKDATFAAQAGRATAHLTQAGALLGVDLKSLMQFSARADDVSGMAATST